MGAKKKGNEAPPPPPPPPQPPKIPLESIPPAPTPTVNIRDDGDRNTPDFIYAGPFITSKVDGLIDAAQPLNFPLQGTFKRSPAYSYLKDQMPVILTKIIDSIYRSKNESADTIPALNKLKSDIMTNKKYEKFTPCPEGSDLQYWNNWIDGLTNPYYFSNELLGTESYIYRKIAAACKNDPYLQWKDNMNTDSLEVMCVMADKFQEMTAEKAENDQQKKDLSILIKLCLWANKLDLQRSIGVKLAEKESLDPLQMILDLKDNLMVDDSNKAADQLIKKAIAMRNKVENPKPKALKVKCSCNRLAKLSKRFICEPDEDFKPAERQPSKPPFSEAFPNIKLPTPPPSLKDEALPPPKDTAAPVGAPEEAPPEGPPPPKPIPCPSKMIQPTSVMFDIVTDNAGFELFMDMCFATYLIKQDIVQKVRFHMKKTPSFISDATPQDMDRLVDFCMGASYSRDAMLEPRPETKAEIKARLEAVAAAEAAGEEPPQPPGPTPVSVRSEPLQLLGKTWKKYIYEETFKILSDDFWTYPNPFKQMKRIDPNLYRKLQFATTIFFKGELNYRRLVGDVHTPTSAKIDAAIGPDFKPAPFLSAHVISKGIACGIKPAKIKKVIKVDEKWADSGNFGAIYWLKKGEALKATPEPCLDYCAECFGTGCPVHDDVL